MREENIAKADALLREVLAVNEALPGQEDADTLDALASLEQALQTVCYDPDAEEILRQVVENSERVLGADTTRLLILVSGLALLLWNKGDHNSAGPLLRRSVAGFERALGADHPCTLHVLNNLAEFLHSHAHYDEAERLWRRALAASERFLGPEQYLSLDSAGGLAEIYRARGEFGQAELLWRQNVDLSERLGDPTSIAWAMTGLATVLGEKGESDAARSLLQRANECFGVIREASRPRRALVIGPNKCARDNELAQHLELNASDVASDDLTLLFSGHGSRVSESRETDPGVLDDPDSPPLPDQPAEPTRSCQPQNESRDPEAEKQRDRLHVEAEQSSLSERAETVINPWGGLLLGGPAGLLGTALGGLGGGMAGAPIREAAQNELELQQQFYAFNEKMQTLASIERPMDDTVKLIEVPDSEETVREERADVEPQASDAQPAQVAREGTDDESGQRTAWETSTNIQRIEVERIAEHKPAEGCPTPTNRIDQIEFTVSCQSMVQPGEGFVVDVFAHLSGQRSEVLQRAREGNPDHVVAARTNASRVKVARGTVLTVRLSIRDCAVEPLENLILWDGEIGTASFVVQIAKDAAEGPRVGLARVLMNGIAIGEIPIQIRIARISTRREPLGSQYRLYEKAFASYASEDMIEVVRRIQGIQKALPELDVFFDRKSLRSGVEWEPELWRHMDQSQVMYLFWSQHAQQSVWVEKEWRRGLLLRGSDFIDPCPLVDPAIAKPPAELSGKHFNDWTLVYLRQNELVQRAT